MGDRVIDLAMTTRPDLTQGMEVLYTQHMHSDHYPIRVIMKEDETQRQQREQRQRMREQTPQPDPVTGITPIVTHMAWKVDKMDKDKLAATLKPELQTWMQDQKDKVTQTATLTLNQVTDIWKDLHQRIINIAHTCVGKKRITSQSKRWWNRDGSGRVQRLHIRYKRAKEQHEWLRRRKAAAAEIQAAKQAQDDTYAEFRTVAVEEKRAAEEEFAASLDDHHKLAWAQYRRAVPRVFTPLGSFPHPTTGELPTRPQESINNLATHLAGVSTVPQDPSFDTTDDDMITQQVQDMLDTPPTTRHALPFTLQQMKQYIPHVRLNTALGTDDVSPYFIKYGGDAMAEALYMLFHISYSHGHIPADFKHGKVAAIYKQTGRKDDPSSYRPIAVTSVVMRLWEKMMKQTTVNLMRANGIPALSQFGFTAKRSTYDAIYRFLSTTVDNFNHFSGSGSTHKHSPAVFIDVSKAYDTVWIQGLLYKLKQLKGITPHLLRFYSNFLLNRTMAVHHSGLMSDTHVLQAGVPQGCVLGPFFYTIYVHDIKSNLHPRTRLTLFADDMALQPLNRAGTLALAAMRTSLTAMTQYARKWKIKFSSTKTNVVFFRPPRHTLGDLRIDDPTQEQHKLKLGGANIVAVKEYKYLGVLLDQHLTYLPHLKQLVNRATMSSHMICRLIKRDKLPSFPVIRQLVASVLIPKMTYGIPFIRLPRIEDNVTNAPTTTATVPAPRPTRGRPRATPTSTRPTVPTTRHRPNTQQKKTNNIARQLKNIVIRPLRLSLGLPHSAHHESVLMESRLMPLRYIQTHLTAMCVERWKGMGTGDNAGADQFMTDMNNMTATTTTAPQYGIWHPYKHINNICKWVDSLAHTAQPSVHDAPTTNNIATVSTNTQTHTDGQQAILHTSPPPHEDMHLCVYTDGASRGNPGHASCGGVIYRQEDKLNPTTTATAPPIHTFARLLGRITNNEAEYTGLIVGLEEAIKLGATRVTSYVDSQLICRQVQGEYAVHSNKMQALHNRCTELITSLRHFRIKHTLRVNNTEADQQCNIALDSTNNTATSHTLTRVLRPVDATWKAFCEAWHKDKQRSLVSHYRTRHIKRQQLPTYTKHDTPAVAAKRARLRFRRALFGYNNKRMNFTNNTLNCDYTTCVTQHIQEDTKHVLLECPRHARDRDKLIERLATLSTETETQPVPLTLPLLLDPPHYTSLASYAEQVSKITGRFLLAVNRNKAY